MARAAEALAGVYGLVDELVEEMEDQHYEAATGCLAFSVKDLLFHLMLDAQRALLALADPADEAPDTDAVSYWQKYVEATEPDDLTGVRFVQRSALAYERPTGLGRHWLDTSYAAVAAARNADPEASVRTQGHVLLVEDFLCTLVVEAAIHYWDLTLDLLEDDPELPADALAITRETLEGLLGTKIPADWSTELMLLKPTGRYPLTDADRAELGPAAERIPVIR